jgi:hypothetical protein
MQVIEDQSKPSFDEDFNFFSAYNWTGLAGALSGPVTNGGNNAPKAYTGLVATHHRPSDDLSLLRESPPQKMQRCELMGSILDTCKRNVGCRAGSYRRDARGIEPPSKHFQQI